MAKGKLKITGKYLKNIFRAVPICCLFVILADRILVEGEFISESFIFRLPLWLIWAIMIPAILLPVITLFEMEGIGEPDKNQKN